MNELDIPINRRELLQLATVAGTASLLSPSSVRTEETNSAVFRIIDTNVSLFRWPFRRLPLDETATLVKKLRSLGIVQAWAGSFEGVFHRDVAGVNRRLVAECQKYEDFLPIGTVNPNLPGWEHDLKNCIEKHKMPGIRLHPNYHGYTLDDPRLVRLLKVAASAGLLVQIAVALEDIRTQPSNLVVPDVDPAPLPEVISPIPKAKVQILNYRPRPSALGSLAKTEGIYFDVARVEGTDGVPQLVEALPTGRVLFGT
ncbi:MAG: amidohydrolase family protein, partial [Planctomycetaceae bacterium]|nr:amidohydrolase family protein [Planctomycetaceae bacterium]